MSMTVTTTPKVRCSRLARRKLLQRSTHSRPSPCRSVLTTRMASTLYEADVYDDGVELEERAEDEHEPRQIWPSAMQQRPTLRSAVTRRTIPTAAVSGR